MAEHAGKPKVRFAGFTEDWEQRKLGDLAGFLPNNTFSRAELSENGRIQNIHYGDVLIKFGEVLDVANEQLPFVAKTKKINKISELKLENGDIVFADAAEDKTVGKCTELFNIIDKIVISGLHTIPCRPQIAFATAYLGYFFNSPCYRTQLLPLMQGIKVLSLSKTALLQTDIFYPKDQSEQARICTFFRHLDRLITLHQRKRGRLENIKKAMLEKMFPKNGADVPEVRFAGFTEAWEQRKLGEIAEKTFGGGTPSTSNPDFWSGKIPWIQSSDLTEDNLFDVKPRKFISKLAIKSSASKIIPKNSIAIIVRVGVGKLALLPFQYSTSQDFLSIAGLNIDGLFASYSIYKKLKKDLPLVQGTSIKGITKEELLGKVLLIPIKKSEQARIGTFFRQLDRLVTLHQRKVALLQNIKKACLEKMFV